MQNFDPDALTKRVNEIEKTVEEVLSIVQPLCRILRPFLPSSLQSAVDELPVLVDEMERLKEFVNTTLPAVNEIVGNAGAGKALLSGDADPALNAVTLPAAAVGEFKTPPHSGT